MTHPTTSDRELTQRELDVLSLLPTRLSTVDIAASLRISPNTVKSHLKHIYHKLDARTRNEAIAHAAMRQLLPLSSVVGTPDWIHQQA